MENDYGVDDDKLYDKLSSEQEDLFPFEEIVTFEEHIEFGSLQYRLEEVEWDKKLI